MIQANKNLRQISRRTHNPTVLSVVPVILVVDEIRIHWTVVPTQTLLVLCAGQFDCGAAAGTNQTLAGGK